MNCLLCHGRGIIVGGSVRAYEAEGLDGEGARICERCGGTGEGRISQIRLGEPLRGVHLYLSAVEKAKLERWIGRELMPTIKVVEEDLTQRVNKEVGVGINTEEVRENVEKAAQQWKVFPLPGFVQKLIDLCDELDTLRAEVARLREKLGERNCSKCGNPGDTRGAQLTRDRCGAFPGAEYNAERICEACFNNALKSLRR